MLRSLIRLVALGLFTCSLSSAFQGQFVYVDATGGDDSNSGLSESDAFRTLTAATTQFASGSIEFVVGPGLYDAAHGETFPIEVRNGATIRHYPLPESRPSVVGPDVQTRPVIDAGGAPVAVQMGGEDDLAPWKGSYNIVIQNAQRGMVVRGVGDFYFGRSVSGFTFRDCGVGLDVIQDLTSTET